VTGTGPAGGIGADDVPRLPRGVRLRVDTVRNATVLLAPERTFNLDPIAAAVLQLVDGERSFGRIVDELAVAYNADRATIEVDVAGMLDDLIEKRVVER
jgi:pyrroloquinoline quinone biosynthesis protein D